MSIRNRCSCVTQLPDDLLCLIYKRINNNCDRKSFGLTCHHFLDIQRVSCKCLDLRRQIMPYSLYHLDSVNLDKLLNHFRHLESLSLNRCLNIADLDLKKLQSYCSQLRCLSLSSCSRVTDIGLTSVASGFPLLSVINLAYCSITDSGLETLTNSCKCLIEAFTNLSCCSYITDNGIWSLNQNCRQLRALNISGCSKVIGVAFQEGFSATLHYLQADSDVLNLTGITGFISGGGLEYLDITFPYHRYRYDRNGHGLAAIGSGIANNLRILNFRMGTFVKDDCIINISKGCPLLQEWNLSYSIHIGLIGWESIGLHCRNLQRLHVNSCRNLCDGGLLALGNGCKCLSVLYMTDCPRISSSGKHRFKKRRVHVKIVEIEGMTNFPSWTFT